MNLKLVKDDKQSKTSQIFDNLNKEQIKAVSHIEGPVLVVAGAGSGKTRVLTHRIANMIDKGINPRSILALTFTNKAADEMKTRIMNLVDSALAQKIWAGTFHSIFARVLRFEAESIGYTSDFSIYDADDSLSCIKKCLANLKISTQFISPQSARSKISWAKNNLLNPADYLKSSDNGGDNTIAKIYIEYQRMLNVNNAMDFDDLLFNFIRVLQNSSDTLAKYQNIFRYILVDEYQDTNRAQYMAINLLAEKYNNIFVVGDDAQSIYGWRGADIRNILEFQKDYKNAELIRLEQNYRSTKNILGAADSLIKHNHRQIPKTLWTDNPEGDKIEMLACSDDTEEAQKIAEKIVSLKKEMNLTNRHFAVLYRTNAQSLALENAFRALRLPYIVIGGMSFYKRKEVKDTFAYLKLLVNPKDSESLLRIINEPPRGLGSTSILHLRNFAAQNQISLIEAFARANDVAELQTRAKTAAFKFYDFIIKFRNLAKELAPDQLASDYIQESGIMTMYKEINTDESLDRWNNIQQVLDDIAVIMEADPERKLVDYLQQVSLISDIDDKDLEQEQVRLMTLHSAKGLEFPVVFIAGLEQGLLPLIRFESVEEEKEEERRLFYVGITRAEKKLFLSHCRRRMKFGDIQLQSKSYFLNEINPDYFVKNNRIPAPEVKPFRASLPKKEVNIYSQISKDDSYSQLEPISGELRAEMRVRHNTFGPGTIKFISGEGANRQAIVLFDKVGKKKLLLQYAKLEIIG